MTNVRRALALSIVGYVTGLTTHMTFAYYLAPLALREAGIRDHDAWVFSGVAIAMMIAVVPAGWLADRVPRRHVLAAGLALQGLAALPLALLDPTLEGVLVGTFLTGVGLGLMVVSFNAYIGDLLSGAEVTPAFGLTSAISILGSAAGPFLAAGVLRYGPEGAAGLRLAALPFVLFPLVGALVALRLPTARTPQTPHALDAPLAPDTPPGRPAWRREARLVVPVMVMYVVLGAAYGMTTPYFTVYFLDTLGFADDAWGVVLGIATIANAVGAYAFAQLATRTGRGDRVVLASQAALALACLLFLLPLGGLVLAGAVIARYGAANGVGPIVNAQLARAVRPGSRAQAQGYGSFAWNAGWATGGAAGGGLLVILGGGLFALGSLLGLAGVAVGVTMLRRAG